MRIRGRIVRVHVSETVIRAIVRIAAQKSTFIQNQNLKELLKMIRTTFPYNKFYLSREQIVLNQNSQNADALGRACPNLPLVLLGRIKIGFHLKQGLLLPVKFKVNKCVHKDKRLTIQARLIFNGARK